MYSKPESLAVLDLPPKQEPDYLPAVSSLQSQSKEIEEKSKKIDEQILVSADGQKQEANTENSEKVESKANNDLKAQLEQLQRGGER